MNLIFLDIDGVLNCQLYYSSDSFDKKGEYPYNQIDRERVTWLNTLCEETNAKVVISSTWRSDGLKHCQDVLSKCGSTFDIISVTPFTNERVRGVEIRKWLHDNCQEVCGVPYYDFYSYAIIDDDSDMLLEQEPNFFHVDNWSGLTPNTCYKIKRFFLHKTF